VNILGYQRLVHLIPFLYGMGCKRFLVLEMEVRVSVYLIIIIITRLDIAIDELMGRKAIFNQPFNVSTPTLRTKTGWLLRWICYTSTNRLSYDRQASAQLWAYLMYNKNLSFLRHMS